MTNSRVTDPEVLEWRFPVLLKSFAIRRGSSGAGAHKGGDGTVRRLPLSETFGSDRIEYAKLLRFVS
jgi:5-oxoprolinase (ATP-hydrolysing)